MNFDDELEPFEQDDESSPWASAEHKAVRAYELYENGQMNECLL